jgi:thioredoxin 1
MTISIRYLSAAFTFGLAGLLTLALVGCGQRTEAGDAAVAAAPQAAAAPAAVQTPESTTAAATPAPAAEVRLPRLVDIGAGTCIPCKMMKPILDDLKATRAHQFETVFVDLNHEREKGLSFGIRLIPTQVFFDEGGRELFRHEGFFSKEEILKTWERLGYKFGG